MSGWWRFVPGTFVIIATGLAVMGRDAWAFFGLQVSKREALIAFALLTAALVGAHFVLIDYVGTYLAVVPRATRRSYAHQFFQVLNDEMIMRAALLTLLLSSIRSETIAVVSVAVLFAVSHGVFYSSSDIHVRPLLTLFAFGVIGNALFVAYRHIWFGFALHLAWNAHRFNTGYYLEGQRLSEGESLNYVEGNPWVMYISLLAMAVVCASLAKKVKRSSLSPTA
jgi:hypothetical protein